MASSTEVVFARISTIKRKLDFSHDMDPNYLPDELRELRTYVLQVHASFETSLEIIIFKDYLKSSESFWSFGYLFERMTFSDKQRLVHSIDKDFPNGATTRLNTLRNTFAHKKGENLRNVYDSDVRILEAFELLEEAHDALNSYFANREDYTV